MWNSGRLDLEVLASVKAALWFFFDGKHDDTTTFADLEDRTVGVALCLTEPPSVDPQDLWGWATVMLPSGP